MSFLSVVVLLGVLGLLVYEIFKLVSYFKKRKLLKEQEKNGSKNDDVSPLDNSQKN